MIRIDPPTEGLPTAENDPGAPATVHKLAGQLADAEAKLPGARAELEAVRADRSQPDRTKELKALADLEKLEVAYRRLVDELTAAIVEHRDEWGAALEAEHEAAACDAAEALAAFRDAYDRLGRTRRKHDQLAAFQPDVRNPWAGVSWATNPRRTERQQERRASLLRSISNSRRLSINGDDVERTLLELELLATGSRPWDDDTSRKLGERLKDNVASPTDAELAAAFFGRAA